MLEHPPKDWDLGAFWGQAARRKSPWLPEGFRVHTLQCADYGTEVRGAVVVGTISRGPRKGDPKYGKTLPTIVVTDAEYEAELLAYEAESGFCWKCIGRGSELAGWSHEEGRRERKCSRCDGTGAAPGKEVPHG